MERLEITDAEYEVMRVVWAEGATTSRHIAQVLEQDQGWKQATSKTLINRLKNKGYLTAEKEGRRFIYSASISEKDSVALRIQMVFADVCNTAEGRVIKDILQEAELSQSDIQDLQAILQERAKTAPEQVTCHCPPGQCQHHKYPDEGEVKK